MTADKCQLAPPLENLLEDRYSIILIVIAPTAVSNDFLTGRFKSIFFSIVKPPIPSPWIVRRGEILERFQCA